MNSELRRLASFVDWPRSSSAWPSVLARCGFHATGDGDTVLCFSCGVSLGDWQIGDDPKLTHRRQSPNCSVANGRNSADVPLTPLRDDFDRSVMSGGISRTAAGGGSQSRDVKDSRVAASSTDQSQPFFRACREALDRAVRKGVLNAQAAAVTVVDPEHRDFEVLRHEGARLVTFAAFPASCPVSPASLARAGFFYTGPRDRVQCAFCQRFLKNWERGDEAMSEHRRHVPDCPLVMDTTYHGNVPAEYDDTGAYTIAQTYSTDSLSVRQNARVSISCLCT